MLEQEQRTVVLQAATECVVQTWQLCLTTKRSCCCSSGTSIIHLPGIIFKHSSSFLPLLTIKWKWFMKERRPKSFLIRNYGFSKNCLANAMVKVVKGFAAAGCLFFLFFTCGLSDSFWQQQHLWSLSSKEKERSWSLRKSGALPHYCCCCLLVGATPICRDEATQLLLLVADMPEI